MYQIILTFIDLIKAELELAKIKFFELAMLLMLVFTGILILFTSFLLFMASILLALMIIVHPSIAFLITGGITAVIAAIVILIVYFKLGKT